jgi:hypothetical protein
VNDPVGGVPRDDLPILELADVDEDDGLVVRTKLDRMEPQPRGARRPIVGGEWSAPTHLSWVAGVRPVEPHTEVADHERV